MALIMARTATLKNGRPIRLYLPDGLIREADKVAFKKDISLSNLVRRLLERSVRHSKIKTGGAA
jgi:hypothetical protein